ncbi:MAG: PrsW family intramembrane metalloprotease [Bacteroidota bacterium]
MLYLYILISLFIAWIWVDYYRLIDIYEKDRLKFVIPTFLLGGASVLIVLGAHMLFINRLGFDFNGNPLNDFLVSTFQIGLLEEIAKTIPFLLVLALFSKQFNEPVDYLMFISVSALGFSAVENVMYFYRHGPGIINGRAILSSVGHMFDTSLVAYGIILYRYKKKNIAVVLLFLLFAALSHGIYDFWLLFKGTENFGWIITIIYFLLTISIYATILNNCLNNSGFFTYKKVVDSHKVSGRLLLYYGIVFAAQFVFTAIEYTIESAVGSLLFSFLITGFIVVVTVTRLSRFKLIRERWNRIRFELPFHFGYAAEFGSSRSRMRISVKGESYNEVHITAFYEEYFDLVPVSRRATYFGTVKTSYMERKLFLKNDESYFVAKVYHDELRQNHETYLLRPKTSSQTLVADKYPIVAVLRTGELFDFENPGEHYDKFRFVEWAYIKPKEAQ